jgi:predicted Zn finger-like uncharacterized protein
MRIVCPSCQATYDVPDATLGAAPRKVRCAKCDMADEHDDAHLPPPVAITPRLAEPIPEPAPIAASHRLPTTHKSSRSAIAPAIAWLVSIAVLVAAAWTVIVWRVPIMQFWAPSQRLYRWLGLG